MTVAQQQRSQTHQQVIETALGNYLAATERWNEVKAVYDETEERLDEARAAKAAAFDELVRAWRLELVERFGIDLARRLSPGPEEIF